MLLKAAFFARCAESGPQGLHVFGGGFDTIEVESSPVETRLTAVFLIEFSPAEQQSPHEFSVSVTTPSGAARPASKPTRLNVVASEHGPNEPTTAKVILNLGLLVEECGKYVVHGTVDGEVVGDLALYVRPAAARRQTPEAFAHANPR